MVRWIMPATDGLPPADPAHPLSQSQTATRATPQTPGPSAASRYPPSLSQAPTGGPSRPPRSYPTPSIDSSIASPPSTTSSSIPLNEYSSLADLLQQAGYKETRVYTPEAEKVRSRIRRTLDDEENEDEVNALYGTYGFDRLVRGTGTQLHQHVTEPSLPLKRSTSILRSLALQDATERPSTSGMQTSGSTPDQSHSWWASAWGKPPAAIATKDISPDDAKSVTSLEASTSIEVGLGLAKGGEGVRRVRSTWEIERSRTRRAGTDSPPQEERPPLPTRIPSSPTDAFTSSATGYTPTKTPARPIDKSLFSSPPPPRAIEEDAFGYCPLPEDYEAENTEDEALYAMGINDYTDVYSLGSSAGSRSVSTSESERSRTPTEDRAEREIQEFEDDLLDEVNEVGKRILVGAVEYDEDYEVDSPPERVVDLPEVTTVPSIPVPTAPVSSAVVEEPVSQATEATTKKPLKYGDRATRLRIAHSTPALRQAAAASPPLPEGWLGSIRTALLGGKPARPTTTTTYQPSFPIVSVSRAPIAISPIMPAQPSLVTASPVICDSISTDAEDLPPVPVAKLERAHSGPVTTLALRLRPSLARLREVVMGSTLPTPTQMEDGSTPVLSPRLDWGTQGEQFAGWSPARTRNQARQPGERDVVRDPFEGNVDALFGTTSTPKVKPQTEIDYTKSFFYKPQTPPRQQSSSPSTTSTTSSSSSQATTTSEPETPGAAPIARRQRSIKSLRAALLLPVAPKVVPPVPPIPAAHLSTPKKITNKHIQVQNPLIPPVLAIQSPGAWEPRELVLEGEEWDAKDGSAPGDWGRRGRGVKKGKGGSGLRRRKSGKSSLRD
ncbi:hypothetical protein CI109_101207 [Kwoniella shandongensis]|uniref:Uncharacterized protein n=1 Tax=Kwoniella shandongensis TaxID=1734106 RepID=A0A5M6BTR1_9TREE|nr:uncharacterized protein CI109_005475 [Kwoniella shandongensis]KAA5526197.1 hypothetical protein CI109_005475 [Kwoniella shandongensis]